MATLDGPQPGVFELLVPPQRSKPLGGIAQGVGATPSRRRKIKQRAVGIEDADADARERLRCACHERSMPRGRTDCTGCGRSGHHSVDSAKPANGADDPRIVNQPVAAPPPRNFCLTSTTRISRSASTTPPGFQLGVAGGSVCCGTIALPHSYLTLL